MQNPISPICRASNRRKGDNMSAGRVLVAGASGLIGTAAVAAFAAEGWHVVAFSRRAPEMDRSVRFEHVPVDLTNEAATRDAVAALEPRPTHLVYAAAYEKPKLVAGWSDPEQMATNRAMLGNVLAPLASEGGLRHVTVMQGTKAYGAHLHPIPIPARERAPRDGHENFYWHQEDLLRELADRHAFDWTIFRPVQVVGPAYGVAYCTPPVIGAFAALSVAKGIPFGFPGGAIHPVRQIVDARVVAGALVWAATSPAAWGEHFNLTNGEVFSWQELWPALADAMGVPCAEPRPMSLADELPRLAGVWEDIVAKHRLRPLSLLDVLGQSHQYADYTFGYGLTTTPPPALVSTVKVKQAGYTRVCDTEVTFRDALRALVERRVLPDLTGSAG
ncbi:NAD-dependent epimerase/dehydratase family protein [Dactylosporangium sp. NPDC005572]|uniref:NAD-dependent epimerase/dehydratase family protein n=1 Tax=Dactylosporangium sp. NPDC005572 TaxID=3156889 RepID=UPI0033A11B9A